MKHKVAPAYRCDVFIAGDIDNIKQFCAEYCYSVGLCVTVTPTEYIYTGGRELGALVSLVNYPRFPDDKTKIWDKAADLARALIGSTAQHSVLVQDDEKAVWFTRREDG